MGPVCDAAVRAAVPDLPLALPARDDRLPRDAVRDVPAALAARDELDLRVAGLRALVFAGPADLAEPADLLFFERLVARALPPFAALAPFAALRPPDLVRAVLP